jgi:hypothetical protein
MLQTDSNGVIKTPLDDGGIRLRLSSRIEIAFEASPTDPRSRKARVITMAWGERYIADLLEITLPALLAPGNLPAFCSRFCTELVIVTETRLFTKILRSPSILRVLGICDVRLLPIDDLLCPHYGVTLTYALVRGFADLGSAITDTHLVFLNSDFVLADGSYRCLAEKIEQGERLIVSPSYCMESEGTIATLRAAQDATTQSIALPPRKLADLILRNRHNTIRAKTVNQRLFRMHRYDQFYWHVDDHTLLGRQLPIAVVYMRPERALTELPTFWDYGVISEYCPTLRPCVLGDSDDFLMAEMRTRDTFRDLFRLGWSNADEIATDLASFTTKDHRDYGRFTLCLHSGPLPEDIGKHADALGRFVDAVYERLPAPVPYRQHPYWEDGFRRFLLPEQRRKILESLSAQQYNDDLLDCSNELAVTEASEPGELGRQPAPIQVVRRSWLADLYGNIFGSLPHTKPLHPYHTILRPVITAVKASRLTEESRSLIVSSGGALLSSLAASVPGKKLSITPEMAKEHLYADLLDGKRFDFCLCGIAFDHLFQIRGILNKIYPLLEPHGRIVIFFQNTDRVPLERYTAKLAEGLFPIIGSSRVTFSGSLPGSLGSRGLAFALSRFNAATAKGFIELAITYGICGTLGLIATIVERNRSPERPPSFCTGMTIEIGLDTSTSL